MLENCGFRPGPTQTELCSDRRSLEARNFGFRKKTDCTIRLAKTKALISFAATAKLICVFVFPYAKSRFSHDAALMAFANSKDIEQSEHSLCCSHEHKFNVLNYLLSPQPWLIRIGGMMPWLISVIVVSIAKCLLFLWCACGSFIISNWCLMYYID